MPFTLTKFECEQYSCEIDIDITMNHASLSRPQEQPSFIEKCINYLLQLGEYSHVVCDLGDLLPSFSTCSHHAWCSFEGAAEIYNEK